MARFDGMGAEFGLAGPQASAEAFEELGMIYAAGRGVPVDLVAAHKWFNIAVVKGCREAISRRAELALEMTREQIADAQRQARAWLSTAV